MMLSDKVLPKLDGSGGNPGGCSVPQPRFSNRKADEVSNGKRRYRAINS